MTSPYDLYEQKERKLNDVATLDYGAFKITIRNIGTKSRAFDVARAKKMKPFERRLDLAQKGELNEAAEEQLNQQVRGVLAEIFADHIIVGWENVNDKKGKKLEYTRENVIKLLTDLPLLFGDIINQATEKANFYAEEVEADAKNSVKS